MQTAITSIHPERSVPVCARRRIWLTRYAAPLLCAALAACGASPARPPPAAPESRPASSGRAIRPAAPTAHFRIDPSSSELRILVYRAGPMASLGHDHVISGHALEGWATFDGSATGAAFSLTVPVTELAVDEARARAEEGGDFAEPVTAEAKAGTLHNMLSAAVLNADQFPRLTLRSLRVDGSGRAYRARVAAEVAGHTATIEVPFTLDATPERLIATGEADIRQSELGLTPFSVFLGALKVKDEMRVRFKLVARGG